MNLEAIKTFSEICSVISDGFISSTSDFLWTIIKYLWPWYWIFIIIALSLWIIFEFATQYTFRSKNGFTPTFNRFIGSGTYLFIQTFTFLLLTAIFGDLVYCLKWPIALHFFTFYLTHKLLKRIGFWVY